MSQQKNNKRIPGFPLVFLMAFIVSGSCVRDRYPGGIEHVVLIGIDGLNVQGLHDAETPCMDSLMQNGAYNFKVRSVLPSVSMPNWHAMISGAGPDITGVVSNSWSRCIDDYPPVVMSEEHVFPNIFRILREQKPESVIGAFYQWGTLKDFVEKDVVNNFKSYPTSLETARGTAEFIVAEKPQLVFIQLDDPDGHGHRYGYTSPEYIKSIEEADKQIQIILNSLDEAGIKKYTMVMVTGDHGGIFHKHGDFTWEELHTPIIYSGKGIKKGYEIKQQIYKYDVAADIAFALRLKAPYQWTGRPVRAAYEGFKEPDNSWSGFDILAPPVLVSEKAGSGYGDLFIDQPAEVIIKYPAATTGDIHYTTDGSTPTRESAIYKSPFKLEKSAIITAKIFNDHGESQKVYGNYRIVDSKSFNGLNYSFFKFSGAKGFQSFESVNPVAKGKCYEIGMKTTDITSLKNKYKTDYGTHFTGWLQIDQDAVYTFRIWADGGYNLFIDNTLVTNNSNPGGSNTAGTIRLNQGFHPIAVDYFTHDNGGSIDVYYEAREFPARMVPADKLFRQVKY